MVKTLGYMVTWTTYGSWLQGDERGYVKDGKILGGAAQLVKANKSRQVRGAVKLNKVQRETVKEAIEKAAQRVGQAVYAIAVCRNHVHMVVGYNKKPVEDMVRCYKNAGYFALRGSGFLGRVWTKGYDKRYCFDEESLGARIDYVRRQAEG